jgi:hypothetical protein
MRIRTGLLSALAVLAFPYPAISQTGAQTSPPANTIPTTITECESPTPNPFRLKNCGTLTWNGQQYDAQWNGAENAISKGVAATATVTISFDKDGVRLDRTDVTGTPGVTATYHGKIAPDNTISGTVTWFNNGIIAAKGKWSGTVTMAAAQEADTPAPAPIAPPPPPTADTAPPASNPSGADGSTIAFLIKIDEQVTDPPAFAGYHHTGRLVWAVQAYTSTFEPLMSPDGNAVDQTSLGKVTLSTSGNSFTLSRQDFQGTEGKAEYTGTMDSQTHGSGTVVWTNPTGTFKGRFTAEFSFTTLPSTQN